MPKYGQKTLFIEVFKINKIQLFCLPYAGGSANIYSKWIGRSKDSVEVYPIELSGRGRLHRKPLYDSVKDIVDDISERIIEILDKNSDYILFGHSLGGILAYELISKLLDKGIKEPFKLFISATKSPNFMDKETTYNMSNTEFRNQISKLGGTPKEVLENDELMDIFTPILRADFKAFETYKMKNNYKKLNCDISLIFGTNDLIGKREIQNWSDYTNGDVSLNEIKGGHFFINTHVDEVLDIVTNSI